MLRGIDDAASAHTVRTRAHRVLVSVPRGAGHSTAERRDGTRPDALSRPRRYALKLVALCLTTMRPGVSRRESPLINRKTAVIRTRPWVVESKAKDSVLWS